MAKPKKFVVGIDVGGEKKGFHAAILPIEADEISAISHWQDSEDVSRWIKNFRGECQAVAIDCPPRAMIRGTKTREAERELHKLGYRIQWTPRKEAHIQEWMRNGEKLWRALKLAFKRQNVLMIETFPTALCDGVKESSCSFPLELLNGKNLRAFYKDYLDACFCALGARQALKGKTIPLGLGDELGPIHIFPLPGLSK